MKTNEQTYAINIQWDTDGEEVNLPERVEIPFNVSFDDKLQICYRTNMVLRIWVQYRTS